MKQIHSRSGNGMSKYSFRMDMTTYVSSARCIRPAANPLALLFAFVPLFLFGACGLAFGASPQSKGAGYVEKAIHKFDGIKDYTVDVKVQVDMKAAQIPEMEAKLYYKAPDKVKIDSKGFFLMPKDGPVS